LKQHFKIINYIIQFTNDKGGMQDKIEEKFQIFSPGEQLKGEKHDLYMTGVAAGFPSPADNYVDKKLDLNEHLILNKAATFFLIAKGDSMIDAGIHSGDLLIVDKSLEAKDGKVVIAVFEGEFTVKRLRTENGKLYLDPENEKYLSVEIKEENDFQVWGVVTNVIHKL